RAKPAPIEIPACFKSRACGKLSRKEPHRGVHDGIEACALILALDRLRQELGERQAGLLGQALHGFWKAQALGKHEEFENVAVLARREVKPRTLVIVDKKRWRALLFEGREALELASRPLERHLARHHLADGQPGADLIEQRGWKAHGAEAS